MKKSTWRLVLVAGIAVTGAWTMVGVAHGDERAATAALLDELDHDAAHKAATMELVKRARAAIERATRLRAAGDEAHAELADGLARQEAEAGRDLVRALEAERTANDAQRAATDAGTMGDRERALLEEGIARNGRLRAELDRLQHGTPAAKGAARPGASAASDGGAR